MILKTIPLQREQGFLSPANIHKLWKEIRSEEHDRMVIAIDGAPGTGKSILSQTLRAWIEKQGIATGIVETDLDCLPWSERPEGSGLMDWHSATLTREVLAYPGARFSYTGYDTVSHKRDRTVKVHIPKTGITIVEGLHSIEYACEFAQGPIIAMPFEISNELREQRRAERNIRQGRWKPEQVESRTKAQRGPAIDFYADLTKELQQTSTRFKNSIRAFK